MMGNDTYSIVVWWLCFVVLGLVFFPLTARIFSRFFDRGYLFARVIGLALTGYGVWLFSSIKILPFTTATVYGFLGVGAVLVFLGLKGHKDFGRLIRENKKIILIEEAIFFFALVFWCFIRGLKPDIEGLEKFMDFGFVNSILRTRYMPPPDMWFAGSNINYYYFGHYLTAFLTKMSGLPSAVTYNLMMATLFAFTFALSFSLGANLIHGLGGQRLRTLVLAGIITALPVTVGGNLHTVTYAHLIPLAKNLGLYHGATKDFYWYPDATRYIGYNPPTKDKTIHEFPIYSFVVSDLHGHVLDIPFVLTILAGGLVLVTRKPGYQENAKKVLLESVLLGFWLSIMYMSNAWDIAIYGMVIGMVLLYKNFLHYRFSLRWIVLTMVQVFEMFVAYKLFTWPFSAHFVNFAKGVGWAAHRSPLYQLFVLWGYQVMFILLLVIILGWGRLTRRKDNAAASTASDAFVLILCIASLILLALPEIIFLRDIYISEFTRANTMFKLTYQAFIMLGLIVGYTIFRVLLLKKEPVYQHALVISFAVVLALPLIYPFYAVNGFYGKVKAARYQGLAGLGFLQRDLHDDADAVRWLNRHVEGQPAILEANGDSYTRYGRISMATGLPTILGWYVHEWLWRGNPGVVGARAVEVATVYESKDMRVTRNILNKYDIRYIVLGKLERDKFKRLDESKILGLGDVVFDSATTKVIQVKQ